VLIMQKVLPSTPTNSGPQKPTDAATRNQGRRSGITAFEER